MAAFMAEGLESRVGGRHFSKIGAPFGLENGQQFFQTRRSSIPAAQERTIEDHPDNGSTDGDLDHPQIEKSGCSESETQKVDEIQCGDKAKADAHPK
jgi:hypothetical protein